MGVIVAMCGIFMAVVTGVFFVYRRMVRGRAQKVILMDGAMCSIISEREAIIRPRVLFNLVVVGMLSMFLLGLFALVVNSLIQGKFNADPETIISLLMGIIIPATAIPLSVRRLFKARYHFDGNASVLSISGRAGRRVSFSEIAGITRKGSQPEGGTGLQTIVVMLKDGQVIEPGTVSGPSKAAVDRAKQIVTVLAQVTGAESALDPEIPD